MLRTFGQGQSSAANAAADESVLSAEGWEHKMRVFFTSSKEFQSWCHERDHLIELHIETLGSFFIHWRCSQYCQWMVGHYSLYLKVLLWTSLMCFKIISFHWICKGLLHLYSPALQLSRFPREGSSPMWCVHTSHNKKRPDGDRPKEDAVAWHDCSKKDRLGTEWVEQHKRSRLTASWDMNLILNKGRF